MSDLSDLNPLPDKSNDTSYPPSYNDAVSLSTLSPHSQHSLNSSQHSSHNSQNSLHNSSQNPLYYSLDNTLNNSLGISNPQTTPQNNPITSQNTQYPYQTQGYPPNTPQLPQQNSQNRHPHSQNSQIPQIPQNPQNTSIRPLTPYLNPRTTSYSHNYPDILEETLDAPQNSHKRSKNGLNGSHFHQNTHFNNAGGVAMVELGDVNSNTDKYQDQNQNIHHNTTFPPQTPHNNDSNNNNSYNISTQQRNYQIATTSDGDILSDRDLSGAINEDMLNNHNIPPPVIKIEQTDYQMLISDLCHSPSLPTLCLACFFPHLMSGCTHLRLHEGDCFYFIYGCCMLDCCCCVLSHDVQRRLGSPLNSCWYLCVCHLCCRCLVLAKEYQAVKLWISKGRPIHKPNGVVMS